MYAKSTRPSAKREVQKERSAKRDDQIARPWRPMRMCPQSGQIFSNYFSRLCRLLDKCIMHRDSGTLYRPYQPVIYN